MILTAICRRRVLLPPILGPVIILHRGVSSPPSIKSFEMKSPRLNVVTTQGCLESRISSTALSVAPRGTKIGRTHSPRPSPAVDVTASDRSASH